MAQNVTIAKPLCHVSPCVECKQSDVHLSQFSGWSVGNILVFCMFVYKRINSSVTIMRLICKYESSFDHRLFSHILDDICEYIGDRSYFESREWRIQY